MVWSNWALIVIHICLFIYFVIQSEIKPIVTQFYSFPVFLSVAHTCFEFWLVHWIVCPLLLASGYLRPVPALVAYRIMMTLLNCFSVVSLACFTGQSTWILKVLLCQVWSLYVVNENASVRPFVTWAFSLKMITLWMTGLILDNIKSWTEHDFIY